MKNKETKPKAKNRTTGNKKNDPNRDRQVKSFLI